MATKKTGGKKVEAVEEGRAVKAVRLELAQEDYERLERCAKRRGLNKASYSRMAVLAALDRARRSDREVIENAYPFVTPLTPDTP